MRIYLRNLILVLRLIFFITFWHCAVISFCKRCRRLSHKCNLDRKFWRGHSEKLQNTHTSTIFTMPVTPFTDFASSNTGVVGSNPTQGVEVCVCLFCVFAVLYVGRGLTTDWSQPKESYRLCVELRKWKIAQGPANGYRPIDKSTNEWVDASPFFSHVTTREWLKEYS
jgi:hypothetical protein